MLKLNKKGMTLVEVLLAMTGLIIISFGMLTLISSLKKSSVKEQKVKNLSEYKTIVSRKIEDDLIYKEFKSIENCNETGYDICKTITFKKQKNNVDESKQIKININSKLINYDNINYYIEEKNAVISSSDINISNDDNFVIVKIPIILGNNDYGIKIVYPISLQN